MSFSLTQIGLGVLLALLQVVAALPWVAAWNWSLLRSGFSPTQGGRGSKSALPTVLLVFLVVLVVVLGLGALGAVLVFGAVQDRAALEWLGRAYGSLLQLQLLADLFVFLFVLLLLVWPKGGAVALASFREGIRQPMFLVLAGLAWLLMFISPFIPYFTFGEDHKMVEEIGYDTMMLAALLFGTLMASMSISEEIEGRTAITLMSKPVSRRQFLLGKFVGILVAALVMTAFLGWWFDWFLLYKRWYDQVDSAQVSLPVTAWVHGWLPAGPGLDFSRGIELWGIDAGNSVPGLVLSFCQVMVLLAVAVSLATRLPMVVNLVLCVGVYFTGHLTPVLVQIARGHLGPNGGGNPVANLLYFMAQLFDYLLPSLEFFGLGTAVVRDNPLPLGPFLLYVGSVVFYALVYTTIVLVFGLILFEDRDLA